jgi:hypothetical protein
MATNEAKCCARGWSLPWDDYVATIQHKQLRGAKPVLALTGDFVSRFPATSSAKARVILIDQLVHGLHWYLHHGFTRPVAINLITGKLPDVIALLDSIAYGDASTPAMRITHDEGVAWSQNARRWTRSAPQPPEPEPGSEASLDSQGAADRKS